MQHVNNTLLGAFRQAARGRLCPVITSQVRTAFTIPSATKDFLDTDAIEPVERLLGDVLGKIRTKSLKAPEEIHIPKLLNTKRLLSGSRTLNESKLAIDARRATITRAAASFTKRKGLHMEMLKDGLVPNKRLDNPLSALQSSPGGGKSTLLDMVGQLSSRAAWTPDLCHDEEMRAILNRSIPVPITFNSDTPWSPASFDKSHQHALALRILHSFFVREGAVDLVDFAALVDCADLMPTGIHPKHALQACRAYMHMHSGIRRDNLLLLVDEARKTTGKDGQDTGLFSAMGEVLDLFRYHQVNILSTTLDNTAFMKGSTTSGRPIEWSSLDRLPQGGVEDMFLHAALITQQKHLHKLPVVPLQVIEEKNARLPDTSARAGYLPIEGSTNCCVLPAAVRVAISDCAGHPRSLEKMQEVFFKLLEEYESAEDWANRYSLKELRDRVIPGLNSSVTGLSSAIVVPSADAVRVALEGKALPFETLVGSKPFSELIASGVFLNTSLDGKMGAVPKLSMLSLLLYKAEPSAVAAVASCIEKMAEQEEAAVMSDTERKPNTLEGKLFEMFFARWLELRLLVANKPVTIREIFHTPEANKAAAFKRTIPVREVEFIHRPDDNLSTLLASAPDTLDDSEGNRVVLLGRGQMPNGRLLDNPAFDIVAVLQDDKQQGVALFLETRFSPAAATTTERKSEINKKLTLFDGGAAKQVIEDSGLGLQNSDIVYVSVLNRRVKHKSADIDEHKHFLKEHVVILDRDSVQKVLTHSLADRALFLMDLRLDE